MRPRYPLVEVRVTTAAGTGTVPKPQVFTLREAELVINDGRLILTGNIGDAPAKLIVKQRYRAK